MENSVNQSGTGSTKIYAVNWVHYHCAEYDQEYTNHYTKYFSSEEEAKEFANEDNLISIYEKWGQSDLPIDSQAYGWNHMYFDADVKGFELDSEYFEQDRLCVTIKEVELDKIILTPIEDNGSYPLLEGYDVEMGFVIENKN